MTALTLTYSGTTITLYGETSSSVEVDHAAIFANHPIPGALVNVQRFLGDQSAVITFSGCKISTAHQTTLDGWLVAGNTVAVTTNMGSPFASINCKIHRLRFREQPGGKYLSVTGTLVEV